jgi:hypothetical protein
LINNKLEFLILKFFQSLEYKNGLVLTNAITQDFVCLYEIIEGKSKKMIVLIVDLEFKE